MRTIGKLLAVAAVVAILGLGQRIELLAGGALGLLIVAVLIARSDRSQRDRRRRPTIEVAPLDVPRELAEDLEGMTVPAKMSAQDALELHQRYAPSFDQQLAVNRHIDQYGDETYDAADSATHYDPEAYAQARAYADLFDQQLSRGRRTMLYQAVKPPRLARGSEPQILESTPSGWDPHKPASVTGMRRVK
jgi:hypothetical protein